MMTNRLAGRRWPAVVAVVGVLAGAGMALAYFTSTGSGTGHAAVGNASPYAVAVATATGGPLLPGSGSQTVTYVVTNTGSGAEDLNATAAALTTDASGGVYDTTSGTFVDGCQASWFTVAITDPNLPVDLAPGGSYSAGSATITMQDSGTNQDACEGLTPQVTVSAN